jgi:hypothetical protein
MGKLIDYDQLILNPAKRKVGTQTENNDFSIGFKEISSIGESKDLPEI